MKDKIKMDTYLQQKIEKLTKKKYLFTIVVQILLAIYPEEIWRRY